MDALSKLKEVQHGILRILAAIPEHSTAGWRDPLMDIHESIVRFLKFQGENDKLAEEFSEPGTLKRFLLKRGFMPNNEADAEAILDSIIKENEERA